MEATAHAIRFNPLKHHLGFLLRAIEKWNHSPSEEIYRELNELGSNQFDLYTGRLHEQTILSEVEDQLRSSGINSSELLRQWLGHRGYRAIILSDGSHWIIREGSQQEMYIHIHPSRHQEQVYRIRANHLKTAVVMILEHCFPFRTEITRNTKCINEIRSGKLGLSPVKSAADSKRIIETIDFLLKQISKNQPHHNGT
jgi:hypothetical protein